MAEDSIEDMAALEEHQVDEETTREPQTRRRASKVNEYSDVSFHPGQVVLYSAPKQRQRWGETQVLPRVNWGDLFFDLFYVAAAFNTANILKESTTARGVLYFVGTFLPVMDMWQAKLYFDARFVVVGDDVYHRVTETMMILVVAAAILHIRPVDVMSNTRDNIEMFVFALTQVIAYSLQFAVELELYLFGQGQRESIKGVAKRFAKTKVVPFILYIAATIVAAYDYFVVDDGVDTVKDQSYGNDGNRLLAGDDGYSNAEAFRNDVPIWLCAGGCLSLICYFIITVQFLSPNDGSHKKYTIPINVDFLIHRNGEWTMLMLGESILSLLIVDVTEGKDYYTTFYCGILTVILLQYLHFRSQPHNPDQHACRRSKDAGVWWGFFNEVYSAALIVVGGSFKLFLYEFGYEETERRVLFEDRVLAGDAKYSISPEQRRQHIANLFCGAMVIVWVCLDAMTLLHVGTKGLNRMTCPRTKKTKIKGVVLLALRFVLIIFFATLSRFETDPNHLASWGLAGIMIQLILRQVGGHYFPQEHGNSSHNGGHVDPEKGKWPNTTHAVATPATDERE